MRMERTKNGPAPEALVVLLHEIYGVNDHIRFYERRLQAEGIAVVVPNLLSREAFPYEEEERAYRYFMEEVGFESAASEAAAVIRTNRPKARRFTRSGSASGRRWLGFAAGVRSWTARSAFTVRESSAIWT